MTDLEILEKTLELYKQQEGNGDWEGENLCLEGCLFKVEGIDFDANGYVNIAQGQQTSAYSKLAKAFDTDCLWAINDDNTREFVIAGIERTIEQERKLDEQVASLLPEGVEREDMDVGCQTVYLINKWYCYNKGHNDVKLF